MRKERESSQLIGPREAIGKAVLVVLAREVRLVGYWDGRRGERLTWCLLARDERTTAAVYLYRCGPTRLDVEEEGEINKFLTSVVTYLFFKLFKRSE